MECGGKVIKGTCFTLAILAAALLPGAASAGSATSTLDLEAKVSSGCTVSTAKVDFGASDGSRPVVASGSVFVNCPGGTDYHVTLDAGRSLRGSAGGRNLSDGSHFASYRIFRDAARTLEWGDRDYGNTYPRGSSLAGTGTGSVQDHRVYGELGTFTAIPDGTLLHDALTVTVYW